MERKHRKIKQLAQTTQLQMAEWRPTFLSGPKACTNPTPPHSLLVLTLGIPPDKPIVRMTISSTLQKALSWAESR